ncbi:MAG: hypothetical protein ACM34K_12745 [Bacillota bacterium]
MELFCILTVWVVSLYIIRLHRELFLYRKYLNQHNDIYVPSYSEVLQMNRFSLKVLKTFLLLFKRSGIKSGAIAAPEYKKRLVPSSAYSKE